MKKKILILLAVLCSLFGSIQAQEVSFELPTEISAQRGNVVPVTVSMNNSMRIGGWSLQFLLPEGVTFAQDEDGFYMYELFRAKKLAVDDVRPTAEGGYQISACTPAFTYFSGNSGAVVTFYLQVAADAQLGTKSITFKNMNFSEEGNISHEQDDCVIPFKIFDIYNIAATSSDETKGKISITPSGMVESGTSVTATASPEAGYEFVNWTMGDVVKSTESTYVFTATEDLALVGNFKARKYDVTFDVDGQKTTSSMDFGAVIATPETPTKIGYTFTGWSPAFVEGTTVPVDGITYTATWTINQYTITFDTDGGSEIAPITGDYASAVTAPANPTKTGYTFMGWDKEIPTTMPAESVTIKAQWQINQYTVKFVADGKVVSEQVLDYGTAITIPEAPAKEGYTFTGWNTEVAETVPANDVTYEAVYSINQYTIMFDTDGGSEIAPITGDYATAVTAPANPTKTGYTFMGWDKEIPTTMPAENVTIKAQWQINQYTITFDTDGGSEIAPITGDYATAVTAPANPTKTGYTFMGWDKEIPTTMPAEDVTIKAQWQINQYTITFDTDGGSEIAPITGDYATAVTAPANPTKTGYTFMGWDKEIPTTMPAESVTIKAQWQINQYTVKFVADGKVVSEQVLDYGRAITVPEAPAKEGYTFTGWTPTVSETVPANDVTYEAVYSINRYTITFDTDGGSEIAPITQDYATAVTAPANPTKTGYTFMGWDKEIPTTMPAEDVTIRALWQVNQYTVTFVADGKIVSEQVLDYGTAITVPEAPAKEGYTFTGWRPTVAETVPANDVTYEAVYTINTYKLTYVLDGIEVMTIEVEYGAEIEAFVPEVEDGREFAGWEDMPATMPAHDVTIYGSTRAATFISNHFANSSESLVAYSLHGTIVMILRKAGDIKRLPGGTYIINGRKVIICK